MKKSFQEEMWKRMTGFSIRTLTVGAVSLAIGIFMVGPVQPPKVWADQLEQSVPATLSLDYRYVLEEELTKEEQAAIIKDLPTNQNKDQIYYMVYRPVQTSLPQTNSDWSQLGFWYRLFGGGGSGCQPWQESQAEGHRVLDLDDSGRSCPLYPDHFGHREPPPRRL